MTTTAQNPLKSRLCSVFSRANGEEPGGSAPSWDQVLIVEVAKPWTFDVTESRHFPVGVSDALDRAEKAGAPARLQAVSPDPEYSRDGLTRVMLFSRPSGPLMTYGKVDYLVPSDQVGRLAHALVADTGGIGDFEQYRQDSDGIREMLVCTQGTRDVCCASFGFPVYNALRNRYAPALDGGMRVWRVSHIGGHRLAPNLVDMPEARNWVRLGTEHLDALVNRDRPVSELRPFYRGWIGLGTPHEQMAEREAFMAEGWDWTNRHVTAGLSEPANGSGRATVRLDFESRRGGASGSYEADVEVAASVPTMDCLADGVEPGEAEQYSVTRLERLE